ncbi:MAG: fibronectin type III domain-containing protein [Bacteroidota bacterium]
MQHRVHNRRALCALAIFPVLLLLFKGSHASIARAEGEAREGLFASSAATPQPTPRVEVTPLGSAGQTGQAASGAGPEGICDPPAAGVVVYDGTDCSGASQAFASAGFSTLGALDNMVESIAVRNGWSALLYAGVDGTGPSLCVSTSDTNLADNTFSDGSPVANQASSIRVYNSSGCITLTWLSPVGDGGVYLVGNQNLPLEVQADDDTGVARVDFLRWDYLNTQWVPLGTVYAPPYRLTMDTSPLLPGWNQVNAAAYDMDGNRLTKHIWLDHSGPAFMRLSPADGATGTSLAPTLTWSQSIGATSYEYCFDTTDDGACTNWTSTGASTSASLSGLVGGTTYYWQVRANGSSGVTYADPAPGVFWSFTTDALLPGAFSRIAPGNGATGMPLSPVLSWGTSTGAGYYEYCYDATDNQVCDIPWINNGTATSVTLGGLSPSTTYYWHARAVNPVGRTYAGGYEDIYRSFRTLDPPQAFGKLSPANGANSTDWILSWQASGGAVSYEYCYQASASSCSNWQSSGASTSVSVTDLTAGTPYAWNVRALNEAGITYSDGDTPWTFTTDAPPLPFNKTAPANFAAGIPISGTLLTWQASPGAVSYEYCFSSGPDTCTAWLSAGGSTSVDTGALQVSSDYYWHVRALNAFGTTYAGGSETDLWTFRTASPPEAFGKSEPVSGAVEQPTSLVLKWGASAGAARYEYCFDMTDDGQCDGWTGNGSATSVTISGLAQDALFYWQVRAVGDGGTTYADGDPGAYWNFRTTAVPGDFSKTGPADGAAGQLSHLTLSWEPSLHATSYQSCYDTTDDNACSNWTGSQGDTFRDISGLEPDTTYYWQVRALNSEGSTEADAGASWSFSTGSRPTFGKVAPADGAASQPLELTLSWEAATPDSVYESCMDTIDNGACDSAWTPPGSSTTLALTNLLPATTYYWQVRATNSFATEYADGTSTRYWHFTTRADYFTISGNAGTPSAALSYMDGTAKSIIADASGNYLITVPYDWSGTVTPFKVRYKFSPASRSYSHVAANVTSQNYTASPVPLLSTGSYDGWVLESSETSNLGGAFNYAGTSIVVGDDALDRQYRDILSFNTSVLPDNAVITKVTLKVKKAGLVGTDPFTTHGRLKVDINSPFFGSGPGLAASDFQAANDRAAVGLFGAAPMSGWYSAVLSSAAFPYVNRVGTTQFRLRFGKDDNDDRSADYVKFWSGNASAGAYRPQLVIEYRLP